MLIIVVRFTVKPEFLDKFKVRMAQQARESFEREPACHRFDIASDPGDPHQILLYEIYSDEAAFNTHLASAHFKAFNTETAEWISSKAVERWIGPWAS